MNVDRRVIRYLIVSLILFLTASAHIQAQSMKGRWQGVIPIPGAPISIILNLDYNKGFYTGTLDSPDQGGYGLPLDSLEVTADSIFFCNRNLSLVYKGAVQTRDSISGIFMQGAILPLSMVRKPLRQEMSIKPDNRYYHSREVRFAGGSVDITLAGTLTIPNKLQKMPTVILISGSGPQDRDEHLFGHKPFLILADSLSRAGYVVLRLDDRGVGKSTGDFVSSTTLDYVNDVRAAIAYLSRQHPVNVNRLYLLGHSEGALVAQVVAMQDERVKGIVMLAGPVADPLSLLLDQTKQLLNTQQKSDFYKSEVLALNKQLFQLAADPSVSDKYLTETVHTLCNGRYRHLFPEANAMAMKALEKSLVGQVTSKWFRTFMRLNPAVFLRRLRCPVLGIYGTTDVQVSSALNAPVLKRVMPSAKVVVLDGYNHLFQRGKGDVSEYSKLPQVLEPPVMSIIVSTLDDWNSR